MMTSRSISRPRTAFSLLECLAYLGVFFIVLGVAFGAYYRMNEQTREFSRNSADIIRAMQSGERWRADVRAATNAMQFEENQELRLTTRSGEVSYFFRDRTVWRQDFDKKQSELFLSNVKSSTMTADARPQVKAWRWEIELQTKRTNSTIRPLFTFLAVPELEVAR